MTRPESDHTLHAVRRLMLLLVLLAVAWPGICIARSQERTGTVRTQRPDSTRITFSDSVATQRLDSASTVRGDSIRAGRTDSTQASRADSAQAPIPDSLIVWDLRPWTGSLTFGADSAGTLTATDLEWMAPTTLAHALATRPGVYLVDQASIGQYMRLTVRGVDWRGVGVTVDGLPAADPSTGVVNLSLFPLNLADRVELVTGPRSFLHGSGAVGGAVNIVTARESHTVPTTAIRYAESAYDYTCSDGSFSQDVSRRVSVSAAYQFQGTEGRYDNTGHEQWNMGGAVRYHPAERWDVTATYRYVQTQTGLNDGIDLSTAGTALAFLPQQARVRNTDAYEKRTRHDVALKVSGSWSGDSTNLTTASVYTSQILREYRDEENRSLPNGIFVEEDHRVARSGLQVRHRSLIGGQTLTAGVQAELLQIVGSPTMGARRNPAMSGWLLDEIAVAPGAVFALFGRVDHVRGATHNAAGTDLRIRLGEALTLKGGLSVAARPSSYAEAYWDDSTVVRGTLSETEQHAQAEVGVGFDLGDLGSVEATYAFRRVRNPVLYAPESPVGPRPTVRIYQGDELSMHSLELAFSMRLGFIMVEGTGGYLRQTDAAGAVLRDLPELYAGGGVYFRDTILGGALELQAGVRGRARDSFHGSTLINRTLFPLSNTRVTIGAASTVDLVLLAHIGDAYVHFLWENLTNAEYFTTPFTPALDRSIRFGISWEFLN